MELGSVRRFDELGRIVLPMEVRHALELGANDAVTFQLCKGGVILKKYFYTCTCCKEQENLIPMPHNKYICEKCFAQIEK